MGTQFRRPNVTLIPTSSDVILGYIHVAIGTPEAVTAPNARFFNAGSNTFHTFNVGDWIICIHPTTGDVTGQVVCQANGTPGVLPAYKVMKLVDWLSRVPGMSDWFQMYKDEPRPLAVYAGEDVNTFWGRQREPDDTIVPIAIGDAELVGVAGVMLFTERDHPIPQYANDSFTMVTADLTGHRWVGTLLDVSTFTYKVEGRLPIDLNGVVEFLAKYTPTQKAA